MEDVTSRDAGGGDAATSTFLSELGLDGSGEYGNHMPLRLFGEGQVSGQVLMAVSYWVLANIGWWKRSNLLPYLYFQSFTSYIIYP